MKQKPLNCNIVVQSAVAQVYTRLQLAAMHGVYAFYADLSPALFGISLTRVSTEQADTLWELIRLTMEMDSKANRLPLAALYISRVGNEKKPRAPFFIEYKRLYGKDLDSEGWDVLVRQVWEQNSIIQHIHSEQ